MFVTIVAWCAFVLTSLLFLVLIWIAIYENFIESDLKKLARKYRERGRRVSFLRVLAFFLIWFASGTFLFQ